MFIINGYYNNRLILLLLILILIQIIIINIYDIYKQNLQLIIQFFIEMDEMRGVPSDMYVINYYAFELNAFILRIHMVK